MTKKSQDLTDDESQKSKQTTANDESQKPKHAMAGKGTSSKRPTTVSGRKACCAVHPTPQQFTIQTADDLSEVERFLEAENEREPRWAHDPEVAKYLAYGKLPTKHLRARLRVEMKYERQRAQAKKLKKTQSRQKNSDENQ